jgi:O-antigen/teichoic acid export membrane protein
MKYQAVVKDYLLYLLGKVFPGIGNLIFVVLFNNLLGSFEYGKYSTLVSIALVIVSFSTTWINQALLRFYTFYNIEKQFVFKNISVIGTIITLLFSVLLMGIIGYFFRVCKIENSITILFDGYLEVVFFVSLIFAMGLYFLKLVLYQAELKPRKILNADFLRTLVGVLIPLCLLFVFNQKNASIVILGLSLSYIVLLMNIGELPEFIANLRKQPSEQLAMVTEIARESWKYGWPLSIWLAATQAFPLMEKFWILSKYDMSVVGIYSSTYELITRFYSFALFPIFMAMNARVMYEWNNNRYKEAKTLIALAVMVEVMISLLSVILVMFNKEFLVELLSSKLGDTSAIAAKTINDTIVQFFITGSLWQIVIVIQKPMEMKKMTKMMMIAVLISVLFHYLFNLLTPKSLEFISVSSALSPLIYILTCVVFFNFTTNKQETIENNES